MSENKYQNLKDQDQPEMSVDAQNDDESPQNVSPSSTADAPQQGIAPPQADNADAQPVAQTVSGSQQTTDNQPPVILPHPPTPTAQEYTAQDVAHLNDAATGKITPETYSDLYGKKDTLGKIGTIFGLLVSGAGSGLTHQPNMLLDMMNKQIDRDLDSQQKNVTNNQNFLNLTYNHELQQAQSRRMQSENMLAQAQAQAIPTRMRYETAQAQQLEAQNAGLASFNRAKNNMYAGIYQNLANSSANNPQGMQVLDNVVKPAIVNQMQQNNQKAAAAQQLNTVNFSRQNPMQQQQNQQQQSQPQQQGGVDIPKMQKMINLGKIAPDVPGAIAPSDVPEVTRESAMVDTNRNLTKIWDDSFKKLDQSLLAGKLNPEMRKAEIDAVATRIAHDSGAMSTDQAQNILDGMFPNAQDKLSPNARSEKYRKGLEHFQGMESATPTLDRYGLKTQFPNYTFTQQGKNKKAAATSQSQLQTASINGKSAVTRKTPDGRTALFDPDSKEFLGYQDANEITSTQPTD
jgi:hypothetical protein